MNTESDVFNPNQATSKCTGTESITYLEVGFLSQVVFNVTLFGGHTLVQGKLEGFLHNYSVFKRISKEMSGQTDTVKLDRRDQLQWPCLLP